MVDPLTEQWDVVVVPAAPAVALAEHKLLLGGQAVNGSTCDASVGCATSHTQRCNVERSFVPSFQVAVAEIDEVPTRATNAAETSEVVSR
jgi:hypothetical protein